MLAGISSFNSVRSEQAAGTKVVDVDGSYLHRKLSAAATCNVECDQPPPVPLIGWEYVDGTSSLNAQNVPKVTHGKLYNFLVTLIFINIMFLFVGLLYTYLADCAGKRERGEAFRSLQCGFNHWESGRLSKLEINFCHPQFCHVHCQMTPSMNQGLYLVYILLGHEGDMATIRTATCKCAAG